VDEEMAASYGRNESARQIGKAIAETLAPLVNSNIKENHQRLYLPVDKQTGEVLGDLANQFETEGA
jgi:hypothetical protein